MSLDANKLYQGFLPWFTAPDDIRTHQQAEDRLARVYHTYAQDAEDVSGERPTNLVSTKFRTPLNFVRSRRAQDFASQIEAAFVAYWTGAVFPVLVIPPPTPPCPNVGGTTIFSQETTSVVASVTPRAMFSAILPIVSSWRGTAQVKARQLADAMDSVTKSAVTVLITGLDTSSPTPVAITNTCTVF